MSCPSRPKSVAKSPPESGACELPVVVDRHVTEDDDELLAELGRLRGILDQERAVQAKADLRRGRDVGVIQKRPASGTLKS